MKANYFIFLLLLLPFWGYNQSAYQEVRNGNELFKLNNYIEAENLYRESIRKDGKLMESAYNLGNSLYRQGKFSDAGRYFQQAASKTEDKQLKSRAYHNLGNTLLKEQKLKEGIDAYKKALLNNPSDEESRYNLAYAQKQLQQQQQQENQDQNKENQDENKDQEDQQNQDNQDQQENQEQEEKGDEEQQNQEEQQEEEQQQQQQQQKEQQVSRDDAERILEALRNDEKQLQEKLKKKKVKAVKIDIEKDW